MPCFYFLKWIRKFYFDEYRFFFYLELLQAHLKIIYEIFFVFVSDLPDSYHNKLAGMIMLDHFCTIAFDDPY